jgi:hypothetical protein
MATITKRGDLKIVDGTDIVTVHASTDADLVHSGASNVEARLNALDAALGGAVKFYTAADIDARDALDVDTGDRAYVIDATDDATVTTGGAEYLYDGTTWIKINESESLDLVTSWADIQNKPTSSVSAIDEAVAAKHSHSNKAVLDKLTEGANGLPLYNGAQIGGVQVVSSIPGGASDGLYFVTVNGGE